MYQILIADNELTVQTEIRQLADWEAHGFSIAAEAANGESACRKIMEQNPDVVLLELLLPDMDGLEVIRRVRSDGYGGRIIIVSGCSDFRCAQEAFRLGVRSYLTKPVDRDALLDALDAIRKELDEALSIANITKYYHDRIHSMIVRDLLIGSADLSKIALDAFRLDVPVFQVVICEKYNRSADCISYSFAELLRVTNQKNGTYDHVTLENRDIILLKGTFAVKKFDEFLDRYNRKEKPQKGSPLDSLFLAYGRRVNTPEAIQDSYREACQLLERRFFCKPGQHTIGGDRIPPHKTEIPVLDDSLLQSYAERLLHHLQSCHRNMAARILAELSEELSGASESISSVRLFLTDLYLLIKDRISRLYDGVSIPFPGNRDIMRTIREKTYLYEILLFFSEQFDIIMASIGHSSRDSVLDDVVNYIDRNYASNITLEKIAPLFGYNSAYLGKIFSKYTGEKFNAYVDRIRIEHSKKLLLGKDIRIYTVAERVGYHNVDYFHIKFKKYVGQSPAEFRKSHAS